MLALMDYTVIELFKVKCVPIKRHYELSIFFFFKNTVLNPTYSVVLLWSYTIYMKSFR